MGMGMGMGMAAFLKGLKLILKNCKERFQRMQ